MCKVFFFVFLSQSKRNGSLLIGMMTERNIQTYAFMSYSLNILILLLFLGKFLACLKYLSSIQKASDKTFLSVGYSFLSLHSGLRIRAEGPNSM